MRREHIRNSFYLTGTAKHLINEQAQIGPRPKRDMEPIAAFVLVD